ncbi:MAG TPA: hypothetical protein VGI74_24580 [Streptosporangiaceae bacterium]|jgi:hypothetical protein
MTARRDAAALPAALRRLAAALDDVLSLAGLTDTATAADGPDGRPGPVRARTFTGHRADSGRTAPDGGRSAVADTETVVTALWPPLAVSLMRDVECRPRRGGLAYRGRVRWIDPDTGRYRGHSRTFDTPADAWAWVATYTRPDVAEPPGQPTQTADTPGPDTPRPPAPRPVATDTYYRRCRWCHHPMADELRVDAQYCSTGCRTAAWRARHAVNGTAARTGAARP